MIYSANEEKGEGLKRHFYYSWDQNKNIKLNKGPNDLISLYTHMLLLEK